MVSYKKLQTVRVSSTKTMDKFLSRTYRKGFINPWVYESDIHDSSDERKVSHLRPGDQGIPIE